MFFNTPCIYSSCEIFSLPQPNTAMRLAGRAGPPAGQFYLSRAWLPAIASQKPRSAEVATEFRCVVRLFRTLDGTSIFSFFLSGSSNTISLSIRSVHINSTHVLVSIRQLLSSRFSTQEVIWNLQASFYHYFNFVNRLGWTNDVSFF